MMAELNTTIEQLCARTDNGLRLYALVDAAHTVVNKDLQQLCNQYSALGLFKGMPEQDAQSAGPYLLPINPFEASHEERLAWLIKIETTAPCLSWLWSSDTSSKLFAHLQAQLIAKLPNNQEVLLRFFDPRVLQQLFATFNPAQIKELSGNIAYWWWYLPEQGRIQHSLGDA